MVLSICGGMSSDIVARSFWSRSMLQVFREERAEAAFSSFRFLIVCLRCHGLSHSARVTPR